MKQKAVKFISRGLFNPLPSSVYSVGLMKQLYLDVTIISVTIINMFVWTGKLHTHTHTLRVTWLTEWWSCALEGNHHSGGLTDWTAHVFSCYHFFSLVVRFCLQTAGRTGSSNICFISSLEIHFVLRKVTYHQSCHWFENENILNPQLIVTLVRSWIPSLLSARCWRPHSDSQTWTSGLSGILSPSWPLSIRLQWITHSS